MKAVKSESEIKAIKKTNYKAWVRFNFNGTTLTELKAMLKMAIDKENRDYQEFLVRSSNEFKDAVTNAMYN